MKIPIFPCGWRTRTEKSVFRVRVLMSSAREKKSEKKRVKITPIGRQIHAGDGCRRRLLPPSPNSSRHHLRYVPTATGLWVEDGRHRRICAGDGHRATRPPPRTPAPPLLTPAAPRRSIATRPGHHRHQSQRFGRGGLAAPSPLATFAPRPPAAATRSTGREFEREGGV